MCITLSLDALERISGLKVCGERLQQIFRGYNLMYDGFGVMRRQGFNQMQACVAML
jgi:hypothetical protein